MVFGAVNSILPNVYFTLASFDIVWSKFAQLRLFTQTMELTFASLIQLERTTSFYFYFG